MREATRFFCFGGGWDGFQNLRARPFYVAQAFVVIIMIISIIIYFYIYASTYIYICSVVNMDVNMEK